MTINTLKSTKSQIQKIKNNIYYESQNKNIKTTREIKDNNNHQIHPIVTTKKKSSNNNVYYNNVLTEIKSNPKDNINNNNVFVNINNNDTEKDNNILIINNNQNINMNKNNNNIISNNNNLNVPKNNKVIGEQIIRKNSKTNEVYKKLKVEFDLLINERSTLMINKSISSNSMSNMHNLTTASSSSSISITSNLINKNRKKLEDAFQNYFKNQKYKMELDKTKIKFFPNSDFFIGILDQDEKFPLKMEKEN